VESTRLTLTGLVWVGSGSSLSERGRGYSYIPPREGREIDKDKDKEIYFPIIAAIVM
jgi:hypothetical protein